MVDVDLIRAAQNGDHRALEQIIRHIELVVYRAAMYVLKNDEDARDATQEVLFKICQKINQFQFQSQFKTWVSRMTTNYCIDLIRRKKQTSSLDAIEVEFADSFDTEQQAMQNVMGEELREMLYSLSDDARNIILMRYVHDYSYQTISEMLNIPLNTVKSHVHRARAILSKKYRSAFQREEVRP